MEGIVKALKRGAATVPGLTLMLSMAAVAQSTSTISTQAKWHGTPAADRAVVYEFANVSDISKLEGPVKQTCSDYVASSPSTSETKTKSLTDDEAAKFAESVNQELVKGLQGDSKRMADAILKRLEKDHLV